MNTSERGLLLGGGGEAREARLAWVGRVQWRLSERSGGWMLRMKVSNKEAWRETEGGMYSWSESVLFLPAECTPTPFCTLV